MAGLNRPWASRDDALFWGQIAGVGLGLSLALVASAFFAWALLLHPIAAWWHDGAPSVAREASPWRHGLFVAACSELVAGPLFIALCAWYCDGMLRGSGKAEH